LAPLPGALEPDDLGTGGHDLLAPGLLDAAALGGDDDGDARGELAAILPKDHGGGVPLNPLEPDPAHLGLFNLEANETEAMTAPVSGTELAEALSLSRDAELSDPLLDGATAPLPSQENALGGDEPFPRGEDSGLPLPSSEGGALLLASLSDSGMGNVPTPPGSTSGSNSAQKAADSGVRRGYDSRVTGSDWRAAVLSGAFKPSLTQRLLSQAFASELEKHIAIQCVALVAGNADLLNAWHWRVWRKANEYGYSLSGKERFPSGASDDWLSSNLHRFLMAATPVLARLYKSRFSIDYLAARLRTTTETINRQRRELSWKQGVLGEVGFHLYSEKITERRYRAYHYPGLGREIFYEGGSRAIYFDEGYYRLAPPSHLFHRVMSILWSVRVQYFVILTLDPVRQLWPALASIHEFFAAQGLSKLTSRLKPRSSIGRLLAERDTRALAALHEKVRMPSERDLGELLLAMREHIYMLLLAETLDVVGVFEAILDKDLTVPGATGFGDVFELTKVARNLLEFMTKMKI
jgi:hypothetical protein